MNGASTSEHKALKVILMENGGARNLYCHRVKTQLQ
jgi:hypothetical protein